MAVQGYNDKSAIMNESIIGADIHSNGDCGQIFINTEWIQLSREELLALASRIYQVVSEIDWQQAEWVYARTSATASMRAYHLMKNENPDPEGKTLCGRIRYNPSWGVTEKKWDLVPVVGEISKKCCDECRAAYEELIDEYNIACKEIEE